MGRRTKADPRNKKVKNWRRVTGTALVAKVEYVSHMSGKGSVVRGFSGVLVGFLSARVRQCNLPLRLPKFLEQSIVTVGQLRLTSWVRELCRSVSCVSPLRCVSSVRRSVASHLLGA